MCQVCVRASSSHSEPVPDGLQLSGLRDVSGCRHAVDQAPAGLWLSKLSGTPRALAVSHGRAVAMHINCIDDGACPQIGDTHPHGAWGTGRLTRGVPEKVHTDLGCSLDSGEKVGHDSPPGGHNRGFARNGEGGLQQLNSIPPLPHAQPMRYDVVHG
jgi:hypothetical protein